MPPVLEKTGKLLVVKNLRKWFEIRKWGFVHVGFVRAVDGVSFDLGQGEAITVVGESGCGKSTLGRTVLGLYPPTEGEILFAGTPINRLGRGYHSQVGFVQQDPYGALPPFMDLHRILLEPMIINKIGAPKERENRIREVMSEVKLTPAEDFLTKFPHMLSGGQQQRAVIARALVTDPKLVVADEPVSMLDASVRVEILTLFRDLQKEYNLGVIYITHDLSTVRYFSERGFVMYAAQIVEKAEIKDLIRDPLHPYTRALLNAIPDPDPVNATVFRDVPRGEPPSLLNPPAGCRFHPRCPSAITGLCDVEEPPEFAPKPGHLVKCWLYR